MVSLGAHKQSVPCVSESPIARLSFVERDAPRLHVNRLVKGLFNPSRKPRGHEDSYQMGRVGA